MILREVLTKACRFGRAPIRTIGLKLGDRRDWARIVMYEKCLAEIARMAPERLEVLEISEGYAFAQAFRYKRFVGTHFPEFDICRDTIDGAFDLCIADQVFEHIPRPALAARKVFESLRPSGVFLICTPFLIKLHPMPQDNARWSEEGLSRLLQEGGFAAEHICTDSWGNRDYLRAQIDEPDEWPRRGFGSLRNDPKFPVVVWAFARKPVAA